MVMIFKLNPDSFEVEPGESKPLVAPPFTIKATWEGLCRFTRPPA